MFKTKRFFKIIIIFLLFLLISGCSQKYLASREEELLDSEILSTRKELDAKIIEQDYKGISLNIQVKDFIEIKDSLSVKEIYKYGYDDPEKKTIPAFWGFAVGCAGCFFGYKIGAESDEDYVPSLLFPNPSDEGCAYACLFGLPGFFMMADGMRKGHEYPKVMPDFVKIDTVCVDSIILIKQKIKIAVENLDFEKVYYTDEYGKIELKIDEILPEPTATDSILGLIINYDEMVDSVEVRFR